MQLTAAILRWIFKRTLIFVFFVLLLFGGYLALMWAVPEFTTVAQTDEQLAQVRKKQAEKKEELQVETDGYAERVASTKNQTLEELEERTRKEVESLEREVEKQTNKVASLNDDLCSDWAKFWEDTLGSFGLPRPCASAEDAVRRAKDSQDRLTKNLNEADGQLETLLDPELATDDKLERVEQSLDEFVDPLVESRIADLEDEIDELGDEEDNLVKA